MNINEQLIKLNTLYVVIMSAFICFSEGCKTYFHTLKRHDKKEKNGNMEKARKAQRKRQRLTNVS